MSATKVQYGKTNYRINREPIDAESIMNTYSDLLEHTGSPISAKGALYVGMTVSVVSDRNPAYNGLYLITLKNDGVNITYEPVKIYTSRDIDGIIEDVTGDITEELKSYTYEIVDAAETRITENMKAYVVDYVNDMLFNWGHLE